ncbi:MAG: LptE family protein [Bacteroidota bacterium]
MFTTFQLILSGCKVNYSLSDKGGIPAEAKTVSVTMFQNNASLSPPVLPQRFTEKLRDMLSSQTNLSLKTSSGDLHFEGYISDYSVAPVAIQAGDNAALNRLTISVQVKYNNRFNKNKDFEQTFTRFNDFPADKSLSSVENQLMDEINRQICEDIFNKAFNDW